MYGTFGLAVLVGGIYALPSSSNTIGRRAASTYQGCYADNYPTSRTMPGLSTSSDSMTNEACVSFCGEAGYSYAGTEYQNQCYCANSLPTSQSSGCTTTCAGASSETCGGSNALSVYQVTSPVALSQAYSLGCYYDNVNPRALSGSSYTSSGMTVEICHSYCESNSYTSFGLEYGQECYCGTGAPTQGTSTGCSMACAGDFTETCGGGNALSAFTIDQNLYNAVSTYSGETYAATGCYADFWPSSRVMTGPSTSSNSMTVGTCASFCSSQGYGWFGLEDSTQCFCASSSPTQSSTGCTSSCAGDATTYCGGSNALNVYGFGAQAASTTTSSIASSPSSSSSSSAVSSSTTAGTTTATVVPTTSSSDTTSSAASSTPESKTSSPATASSEATSSSATTPLIASSSTTSSSSTAGFSTTSSQITSTIQSSTSTTSSVLSSPSSSTFSSTSASASTTAASSGASSSTIVATTSTQTTASASASASASSLWSYVGCQGDFTTYRNLNSYSTSSSDMTVEKCQSTCLSVGYAMAGVEYSTECYCAAALRFDYTVTGCNMACGGDSSEICGGGDALSVYSYTGTIPTAANVPSVTTSNGVYTYGGCFQDDYPYRVLSAASSTSVPSVEQCVDFCSSAGYAYAGVEYYGECYCDNELVGSQPLAASACNTPCSANGTEICGGSNALSIYGTKTVEVQPYPSSAPAQKLVFKGHDISSLIMLEDGVHAAYEQINWQWNQYEADNPPLFEQLLSNYGSNVIRIRLWTSPDPNNFDGTTYGLAYAVQLARRAVASGQTVMLNVHYSDYFADPGKQTIPTLWQGLSDADLLAEVTNYTTTVLDRFAAENVPIGILGMGNEIRNGMLWPLGGSSGGANFQGLAQIQNAIIAGVDASVLTRPKLMLHPDGGANRNNMANFFGGLFAAGLSVDKIDMLGLTWYPYYSVTDTQAAALDSFTYLANTYNKPILVVETNWPITCSAASSMPFARDLNINQSDPNAIPFSAQGQSTWLYMVSTVLSKVPNGLGQGILNWESGWSNSTSLGTACEQLTMIQDYWYHYDATAEGNYAPVCLLASSCATFSEI